ncbi:MAG: hypothetical protein IPM16_09930 [Chloroflexi bacterium]|nr:hypothetical protein [Chloroflexota bacterium]
MNDERQNDSTPAETERDFEELTLSEALGDLLRRPRATARNLAAIASPEPRVAEPRPRRTPVRTSRQEAGESVLSPAARLDLIRVGMLVVAVVLAFIGTSVVYQPNDSFRLGLLRDVPAGAALPWWIAAIVLGAAALRIGQAQSAEIDPVMPISAAMGVRLAPLIVSLPLMFGAYILNSDNQFSAVGALCWALAIAAAALAFTPQDAQPMGAVRRGLVAIRDFPRREPWIALLLAFIVVIGVYARFNGLSALPAEMTSDHVEKLLDAQNVLEGSRDIFFANNGGREPFQMYFVAALGSLSGQTLSFAHLKIASALESLLSIPLFFLLGRVVIGAKDERLGTLLGLAAALFVAVGYWHLAVTRVSLRIILTPMVTAVFLMFVIRLMRFNRREDAVMAGLTLGFGLYAYQALRMLPVIAVFAAAFAVVVIARSWAERRAVMFNLIVIAFVSFAFFVPLFRYSNEHPEEFWRRASGRLLGDDIITETLEDGSIVSRQATIGERASALVGNLPQLGNNFVRAMGMFTYRGDVAWFHNAPNYPAFDPLTGALFLVGLGAFGMWTIRSKEYASAFLIVVLLLMLVPSAVAVSNPVENPSSTRASGAMPTAYLFAAFGAVALVSALRRVAPRGAAGVLSVAVIGLFALNSLSWANTVLFGPYNDFYQNSWSPQREAGQFLRGFAESDGAWGNAFILAAANFFDYRGVAMDAGLVPGEFPNGDIPPRDVPARIQDAALREGKFKLDPSRDLMFMYAVEDTGTTMLLERWFPEGRDRIVNTRQDTPWLNNEQYRVFRVPALGVEGLEAFVRSQGLEFDLPSE